MFVNLKLHTDYSLLEGVAKVEDYIEKAKSTESKYLGLCDNNMYATMKMYNLCKKFGLEFVAGLDLYVYGLKKEGKYVITVYAKGEAGYKDLVNLSSLSYTKKGVVDITDINKFENITILLGSINSELYEFISNLEYAEAKKLIEEYKKIFNKFYLELPCFSIPKNVLLFYQELALEYDLEPVAVNDTYYVEKEDYKLQKIVSAIRDNININKVQRYYKQVDLYFKSEEEILKNLQGLKKDFVIKAINNTELIAKSSSLELKFSKVRLPKLNLKISEKEYLKELVYSNLEKKYAANAEAKKRLDYELEIIDKMGFNSYFIIVYDIVNFARKNDILIGPGRGSAAGSIVAYLLDITKVDPIKYELMFERFLNIARKNLPDIDLDFETDKKEKVVQYVMEKYGQEHVANIITFSTFKEKQLYKDLCRIFNCNEKEVFLKKIVSKLINNVRHSSIHASGIIISDEKLTDFVPINKVEALNINITQYQMEELEKMGLLKMDFLSLLNLDILSRVSKLTKIKLDEISLLDKKVFDLYNEGKTLGIFQVEALGITKLIKKFKINKFEDISAVLALYRPGPLKSGMVEDIIDIKNNKKEVKYLFEDLKPILENTYGMIIYQEQVMLIARKIAGFNLNEADDLRKAISKKKQEILEEYKNRFITSSIKRGYAKDKVEKLYSQIEKFGEYGFNKSHSIAYAMLSYYTAYFKTYYKKEYLCSLLNVQIGTHDKIERYNEELNYLIKPSINKSDVYFKIEADKIRYAIYSISNISINLAKDIVEEREKNGLYKDIIDFLTRMQKYSFTKNQFETLVKAGTLDEFEISRKELIENSSKLLKLAKENSLRQDNVLNPIFMNDARVTYEKEGLKKDSIKELVEMERTSLGLSFSQPKNDLVDVLINKVCYENEYEIILENKRKIKLRDLNKYSPSYLNILLDDLSEAQKKDLKNLIRASGGFAKVQFYLNKKKLFMKHNIYFDLTEEKIKKLINIVGKKHLSISVKAK